MKVGMIGAGQIAEVHGPLIRKHRNVEIVGIADIDLERARRLTEALGVGSAYDDAGVLLEEARPDVVHILVPPQFHAELSILAMDHGCHALVEKPMALTVAEAQEMIEAAKRNGVSLCVDHNPLFDRAFSRAVELAKKGVIGEVVSVEAHEVYDVSRNPDFNKEGAAAEHWLYRTNGGPLEDMLPHPAALIFEFMSEFEEIRVLGLNRGVFPEPWQDELKVLIKSADLSGYISISASERPDICSLTIRGTGGILHADSYNMILTVRKTSNLPRKVDRGLSGFRLAWQNLAGTVDNTARTLTGRIDKANGIDGLIAAFYESIRRAEPSPVPPESGLRVVEFMNRVWPAPAETAGAV